MTSAIDLLEIAEFLDASACEALRVELADANGRPATVTGLEAAGAGQPLLRRGTRATVPPAMSARIADLLMARRSALEHHFGVALASCEEPQFLRYQPGDFF